MHLHRLPYEHEQSVVTGSSASARQHCKPIASPRQDCEFLPQRRLEILETPASPIRMALIWSSSVFWQRARSPGPISASVSTSWLPRKARSSRLAE